MSDTRIVIRHFQADGNAHNLILGGVPNYVKLINLNAAAGEIAIIEWFKEMGDAAEIHHYKLADDGSTSSETITYVGTGGYISDYSGTTVDAGTSNTDSDPCRVTGGEGITIATEFMDDNDEIYVYAVFTDRDVDDGDIA